MAASIKKENSIFFNHRFDKKRLKALISWVFKKSGEAEALRVLDLLKETGFRHATRAGISIGVHDLATPIQKSWLISESQLAISLTDRDFVGAKITATERSQRIVDTWHRASESLSKQVVDYFGIYDQFNPVYIMALSGARGNFSQVRQLIGMRGLMADQQGKIVNFPIRSNLREGLTLTEYFISCSGARKGLVDTALRTADTGYLTRRLVDVSHNVVVKRVRCNTTRAIAFKSLQSYNKTLLDLRERLVGRVLAQDVQMPRPFFREIGENEEKSASGKGERFAKDFNRLVPLVSSKHSSQPKKGVALPPRVRKVQSTRSIALKDEEISPKLALKIAQVRDEVSIRSPLTCGFTHSVCQLCYGWSISQGSLVSLGDAVGVIAAQSIGEPGTQLTMRTFHTGGVFSGDLLQEIRAPHAGTIEFSKVFRGLLIRTAHGRIAFLSKVQGELILRDTDVSSEHVSQLKREGTKATSVVRTTKIRTKDNGFTRIPIEAFTMLFVRQGEHVEKNQLLAEFSIQSREGNQPIKTQQTIFAELSGRVVEDRSGKCYTKSIKESIPLLEEPLRDAQSFCKSFVTPWSATSSRGELFCKSTICRAKNSAFPYPVRPSLALQSRASAEQVAQTLQSKVTPSVCAGQVVLPPTVRASKIGIRARNYFALRCLYLPSSYSKQILVPFRAPKGQRGARKGNALAKTRMILLKQNLFANPWCNFASQSLSHLPLRAKRVDELGKALVKTKRVLLKQNLLANPEGLGGEATWPYAWCNFAKQSYTKVRRRCYRTKPFGPSLTLNGRVTGSTQTLGVTLQSKVTPSVCEGPVRPSQTLVALPPGLTLGVTLQSKVTPRLGAGATAPSPSGLLPCLARQGVRTTTGQLRGNYGATAGQYGAQQRHGTANLRHERNKVKGGRKRGENLNEHLDMYRNLSRPNISVNSIDMESQPFRANQICKSRIFSRLKNRDLENDAFKYIEPVKAGRLGFLKILSTRVGATLDYTCPIKPFNLPSNARISNLFAKQIKETSSTDSVRQNKTTSFSVLNDLFPEKKEAPKCATHVVQIARHSEKKEMQKAQAMLVRLEKPVKYLHPEYIKESRFFLQTVAEYGDVVEEAYKTKTL